MDLNFGDERNTEMLHDMSSFFVVTKSAGIKDSDFNNVIKILDESGSSVDCTYDKFVEILDQEGLAGFIL